MTDEPFDRDEAADPDGWAEAGELRAESDAQDRVARADQHAKAWADTADVVIERDSLDAGFVATARDVHGAMGQGETLDAAVLDALAARREILAATRIAPAPSDESRGRR